MIGLEVEALFQSPQDVAPSVQIEPLIGSASLIVQRAECSRMSVYLLGGYSRSISGATSPYPVHRPRLPRWRPGAKSS